VANDALVAKDALVTNEAVVANEALVTNEAVVAKDALVALLANDAVPNKLPVIPPDTFILPVTVSDPVIT
jgi:carbonic anhydrase/acetyltransferase-like protein (isoleucine patch superfamily)